MNPCPAGFLRSAASLLLLAAVAERLPGLYAQERDGSGLLRGTVTSRHGGSPLPGVNVTVRAAGGSAIAAGGHTDLAGRYLLGPLGPGAYAVTFSLVGYRREEGIPVDMRGETVLLDAALEEVPLDLDAVVVSASRREEKAVGAPGSTSVIDAAAIAGRPAVTPVDHLRSTGGIDIAQTGLMQQTVVARGFNNVFSTTVTMLTDHRIAAVPSLRANIPSFIPSNDDDIERIEVVRGPASALYGPNANNGVVHIITRSPLASRGTSYYVAGGSRWLAQGGARHAGSAGDRVGYKISAQYFRGRDWESVDSAEAAARRAAILDGADPGTLRIGRRDPFVERFAGEGRVDFLTGEDAVLSLGAGFNQAVSTIELTDIGAAQGRDWRSAYAQTRFSAGDLFLQAYLNASDAGGSFILRTGMPVVDRSTMAVAQAQHRWKPSARVNVTYGADLHLTRPVTGGTITGRNEGDDGIDEAGAYAQSETALLPGLLDLVLAARLDRHNRLDDAVVSPRAALVLTPAPGHALRLTWNRAFSTPNTTELFLDIVAEENFLPPPVPDEYNYDIRGAGIPRGGYRFPRDANGRPMMHSPLDLDKARAFSVDDAAGVWPALAQVLADNGIDVTGVPPPTSAEVRPVLGLLDARTRSFTPVADAVDVPGLGPTITRTLEAGWRGAAWGVLSGSVDAYRTDVTNFIGQFEVRTPSVFLNAADVRAHLERHGYSSAQASFISTLIGSLPVGTVTPEGAADPTALLVTPRNFGRVSLWGADVSVELAPHPSWRVVGTFSLVSENYFEDLDGDADLSLNSPRRRGTVTVRYRHPGGAFHAEGRGRWMSGFRMSSGVYAGDVEPSAVLDLAAGLALPGIPRAAAALSVTNLLDRRRSEFIGAPAIGRLVILRIHHTI